LFIYNKTQHPIQLPGYCVTPKNSFENTDFFASLTPFSAFTRVYNPFAQSCSPHQKTFILSALPANVKRKGDALRPLSFLQLDFRPWHFGGVSTASQFEKSENFFRKVAFFTIHRSFPLLCPKNATTGHTARHRGISLWQRSQLKKHDG